MREYFICDERNVWILALVENFTIKSYNLRTYQSTYLTFPANFVCKCQSFQANLGYV